MYRSINPYFLYGECPKYVWNDVQEEQLDKEYSYKSSSKTKSVDNGYTRGEFYRHGDCIGYYLLDGNTRIEYYDRSWDSVGIRMSLGDGAYEFYDRCNQYLGKATTSDGIHFEYYPIADYNIRSCSDDGNVEYYSRGELLGRSKQDGHGFFFFMKKPW